MILVIDNFKIFEKWASKTYEYKINSLREDKRFKVIDIEEIENINYLEYDKMILGWNMCKYSKYYTIKNEFYSKKINNLESKEEIEKKLEDILKHPKKYLIVQDFINNDDYENGIESLNKYLEEYNILGIISPYLKTDKSNEIKSEIYHLPHHIDSNKFMDWGREKKYDIFIYGNCSPIRYPLRNRILKLLKKESENLKILFWENKLSRNYFRFNNSISNENLSKRINESWLCVCTSSYSNVLLGKYIETSMSGSCVLGDMPEDGREIWENNFVEIRNEMSDDDIIERIKESLKDKEELLRKIEIMKLKIENYSLDKFSSKLYDLLN